MITQDELKNKLDYNADTGVFIWKNPNKCSSQRIGMVAGHLGKQGYLQICINRKLMQAHRLAWLYMHGELPKNIIDHIDGNKANNRILNLRDIDRKGNSQNTKKAKSTNKASGLLGVSKNKKLNKFTARITVSYKSIFLGLFDTPELAHDAYVKAKRRLHSTCEI